MNERRNFLKLASAVAIPAAAAVVSGGAARADDGSVKQFLGAWSLTHSLPFPPGSFHEFLSLEESGSVHETNSFLHNSSNLAILIPGRIVNASDGFGNWYRLANGLIQVYFRKMLFDAANHSEYFGDLHVTGQFQSDGANLTTPSRTPWHIEVQDLHQRPVIDFGTATSEGPRIG